MSIIENMKEDIISWITENNRLKFDTIFKDMQILKNVLLSSYKKNITNILHNNYPLNYNSSSMDNVNDQRTNEKTNLLKSFNMDNVQKMEVLSDLINKNNENMLLSHNKYHQL